MKKRILIGILIITLILQPFSHLMPVIVADNNESESATATGKMNLGGSSIQYQQELKETGNGTYTLSLDVNAGYSVSDANQNQHISRNHYFTAAEDGDYLLELWGGSGASGQSTSYNEGGTGGAGGYIYGVISLKKGETLFYHLGGNGEKTLSSNEGGGVNGNGGGHGDTGNFTVGGGGGYSAIYKFSEGEFEQKYLDKNGALKTNDIFEEDRMTKYIMIAGGGGGGGAGSGFSLMSPIGSPDGGTGGSIDHVSGTLSSDNGYDVPGTFFSGKDGKSSGISTAYVGRGGTNIPGRIADSLFDLYKGKEPNDWKGTYNKRAKGGAGGAGNLRGGGGGAGFCGGSGGVMTGITTPTNVGGGGGGSSFIADSIDFNLNSDTKKLLSGSHRSETGGAINIYSMEANKDMTFLESVSFSTTISKYFDIESVETLNDNGKASFDSEGNIKISNANISPDERGYKNNTLSVHIKIRTKSDFAGGNSVPILLDGNVICTTEADLTGNLAIDEKCRYVNVPLNFNIKTYPYMTNNNPLLDYPVSNLYEDTYANVRNDLASYWQYDFIDSISEYKVTDESGNRISDKISNLEKSTNYTVSFEVVPKKTESAAVGPSVNAKTFSEVVSINILKSGEGTLNDKTIHYSKKLTYNEEQNQYVLSLNVKTKAEGTFSSKPDRFISQDANGTYTVPSNGYYFIQAWGGDGGAGEDGYFADGGSGGKGGYVSGYCYLTKGAVLTLTTGSNGITKKGVLWNRGNGTGGGYTSIVSGNTTLLIAGGGGGGGGASDWANSGGNGASVSEGAEKLDTPNTPLDKYYKGETGSATVGGAAGANFIHTSMNVSFSENPLTQDNFNPEDYKSSDYKNKDKGAIYITCLQIDDTKDNVTNDLMDRLSGFSLTEKFSKYFSVTDVTGENCELTHSVAGQTLSIRDINPSVTTTEKGNTISSSVDFTVNVYLEPKKGFLGGNDVPILVYENNTNTGMILSQGEHSMPISQQDATDFANVEIPVVPNLTVHDKTYIVGDPGIPKNDLYEEEFPTVSEDWMDDFVVFIHNTSEELLTPVITTDYEIVSSIKPKNEASKAVVITSVEGTPIYKAATIHVEYEVVYHLTNMNISHSANENGRFTTSSDSDLEVMLDAEKGYLLPEEVTVSIGDKALSKDEYTYDSSTGALIITKEQFIGTFGKIEITASADVKTYTLHYVYETEPGGLQVKKRTEKYAAGANINPSFIQNYNPKNYEGYDFEWHWATEDGNALESMPAEDWWVIGSYVPKKYKLKINYFYESGSEPVFPSVEQTVAYGSSYSIESPQKDGYLANIAVVSGVMEDDLEVDVYYKPTENQLNIIYIRKDTNEVVNTFTSTYATNEEFSVTTPELTGYSANESVVSGIMTSSGITKYVYFEPNHYVVTFDAGGGNCNVSEKEVVYNNVYGYNGSAYEALPTPVKVGYEFEGWSFNGEMITEATVVKTADNHELKAVWKETTFSVTIQYLYEDGREAAEEWTQTFKFGETYSCKSPSISGYKPSQETVSGTVPAQNTIIKVIYSEKEYTLTIDYLYSDGNIAHKQHEEKVLYNGVYTVYSPEIEGYSPSVAVVTGKMPAEDKHIVVYYYEDAPVISATVEWGNLSFDYTKGDWDPELHKYESDHITPTNTDTNYVKVTNTIDSTVYINSEYDYASETEFQGVNGYFTTTNDATGTKVFSSEIEPGKGNTVYLWLTGRIPEEKSGSVISGQCKVKISGGKENR